MGTIASITEHSTDIGEIISHLWLDSNYGFYFPILMISLLPLMISGWLKEKSVIASFLFFATVPLYLLGEDYGRWIQIFVTFLTFIWLAEVSKLKCTGEPNTIVEVKKLSNVFVLFFVFFVIIWRVPHSGEVTIYRVFYGLLARLLSWIQIWPSP
jgi:hypothetical protein